MRRDISGIEDLWTLLRIYFNYGMYEDRIRGKTNLDMENLRDLATLSGKDWNLGLFVS